MEKIFERGLGLRVLGTTVGLLALTSCASGKANTPSIEDIKRDSQFVEVTRPDGTDMDCLYYGARGGEGYAGFSWLILDCDWDNNTADVRTQAETQATSTTVFEG